MSLSHIPTHTHASSCRRRSYLVSCRVVWWFCHPMDELLLSLLLSSYSSYISSLTDSQPNSLLYSAVCDHHCSPLWMFEQHNQRFQRFLCWLSTMGSTFLRHKSNLHKRYVSTGCVLLISQTVCTRGHLAGKQHYVGRSIYIYTRAFGWPEALCGPQCVCVHDVYEDIRLAEPISCQSLS